ncbi:hypothetical protein KDL45_11580, partial [bacterium]|nr:hypothetical protein [bacterium]
AGQETTHFAGGVLTARIIAQLKEWGLTTPVAMRVFPMVVSFIGFAAIVALGAYEFGGLFAAILAILLIFPHDPLLRWSLITYGGYPEAASLSMIAVALWAVAWTKEKAYLFALAGLAFGLVCAYSVVMFVLPLSAGLVTIAIAKRRWLYSTLLVAGFIPGVAPFFVWLKRNAGNVIEPGLLANNQSSLTVGDLLVWPTPERLHRIYDLLHNNMMVPRWQNMIIFVALVWVFAAAVGKFGRWRWTLLFPLTIPVTIVGFSIFTYVDDVDTRHVLWFFPVVYFCVALLFADLMRLLPLRGATSRKALVGGVAARGLLVVLLCARFAAEAVYAHPGEMGKIHRYEGLKYQQANLFVVWGDDLDRVNCFLDTRQDLLADGEFATGFAVPFYIGYKAHTNRMIASAPSTPDVMKNPERIHDLDRMRRANRNPGDPNEASYFRGMGCAAALKAHDDFDEDVAFFEKIAPAYLDAWKAGYEECAAVECPSANGGD